MLAGLLRRRAPRNDGEAIQIIFDRAEKATDGRHFGAADRRSSSLAQGGPLVIALAASLALLAGGGEAIRRPPF
jgi:hypothetical protein